MIRTIGLPIIYACARATAISGRPRPRSTGRAYTYRGYLLPQRRRSRRLAAAAIGGTVAAGVAVWAAPATGRDTGETAALTSSPRSGVYSASAPSSAPAKKRPGDSGNSGSASSPNSGSSRSDSNSSRSAASAMPASGGVMTLLPAPRGGIPGSPPNSQAGGTASGQQGGLPPPPVATASSGAQPCRQVTTDQVQAALASAQPGQLLCLATYSSAASPSGSGLPSSVPSAEAAPQVPHVAPSTSGTVVSPAPNSPSGLSSLSTLGEGTVTVNIPFLTGCITVANTAAKSSNHAPAQIRLCGSHQSSQRP